MHRRAFLATLPATAAASSGAVGGPEPAVLDDGFLPAATPFVNVVSPDASFDASWEFFFKPNGQSKDGILIHHTLNAPSAGLHVLSTASPETTAGHAGGFAMSGGGTANAITGNRYEDGDGHASAGNRVGTGNGYGGHFGFSSEGEGGALYAIKQNSGYTGLSGAGPSVRAENLSDHGEVIISASSPNNDSPVSNAFFRHNSSHGIVSDLRVISSSERSSAFVGSRVAFTPGAEWGGAPTVTGIQTIISNAVTGSELVAAADLNSHASGNKQNVGVLGDARGGNDVNYGGKFSAADGVVNVALRADGDFWLIDGTLYAPNLPVHDGNAQAIAASLEVGRVYRTSDGVIRVVVAD